MMEMVFEFSLNMIDGLYLVWFYMLLIDEKSKVYRIINTILIFSIIQFTKDAFISLDGVSSFIDTILIILVLYIFAKRKNFQNFLCAIIVESIFMFSIVTFVALALELSVDIESTLQFGLSRVIFCVLLKLFTIILLYILLNPLKQLYLIMNYGGMKLFSLLLIVSLTCLSYVYGNSNGNEQIFIYTVFLTVILFFVYYLFYRYCKVAKEYADSQTINAIMKMTKDQITMIDFEYEQYRKLKHDMNNQLSILYELQKQGHYTEVLTTLKSYHDDIKTYDSTLTGNIYLDSILRLKLKQYETIHFNLEIVVSKDIAMEGKDIVSLLSNIIDNAYEELCKTDDKEFALSIKGDNTQLQIFAKNKMRSHHSLTTEKNKKYHGFGLKIIHEIVEKYEGTMDINTGDYFTMKILILF